MNKSQEIQVEEKQVAEIKDKVQTVKNSLEVTNSSIKQTQMTGVNEYRGDKCQNYAHAEPKSSESKRTSRLVRNLKLTGGRGEARNTESRTRRTRRKSKPVRNILTKEKLEDKSPRGQVYVEAHHEEVQGCELRGQGNFEWNTDLIEKKKLENNTRQVAQDLYSGEAQHEPRGAHEEQLCRSLLETSGWIENAVARKDTWTSNPGWYEW